jgi:hypothetical protein
MIILASLSSGQPTTMDPISWVPRETIQDSSAWELGYWQKTVVFLLGTVHNFWVQTRDDVDAETLSERRLRWIDLTDRLERHRMQAPPVCSPLCVLVATESNPFEAVHYLNGSVAAAWQMLYVAFFIHTICEPCPQVLREGKLADPATAQKALAFARRAVANSITNKCVIAWANAVQLLTTVGQCLVAQEERDACVFALEEIQRCTGWNTRDNLRRLLTVWDSGIVISNKYNNEAAEPSAILGKLLYTTWKGD